MRIESQYTFRYLIIKSRAAYNLGCMLYTQTYYWCKGISTLSPPLMISPQWIQHRSDPITMYVYCPIKIQSPIWLLIILWLDNQDRFIWKERRHWLIIFYWIAGQVISYWLAFDGLLIDIMISILLVGVTISLSALIRLAFQYIFQEIHLKIGCVVKERT